MEERGRIKVGPAKCAGCGHGWINRLVDAGTLWGTKTWGGRLGGVLVAGRSQAAGLGILVRFGASFACCAVYFWAVLAMQSAETC